MRRGRRLCFVDRNIVVPARIPMHLVLQKTNSALSSACTQAMCAAILLRYSIQTILYSTRRQSNLLKQPVKVGGKKKDFAPFFTLRCSILSSILFTLFHVTATSTSSPGLFYSSFCFYTFELKQKSSSTSATSKTKCCLQLHYS